MATERHLFQPRGDDCCHCGFCGYPDSHQIHHSETGEEVPDARHRLGLNKVERAPATTAAPILCQCGHGFVAHPDGGICHCGITNTSAGDKPNGFCMGWQPATTAAPCTCGHDRGQHPPNHFAMFGWHCKVVGCSCGMFEPADPKVEQTHDVQERAIQLAAIALHGKLFGTPEQLRRYATVAVTAAWDILAADLLATRDRLTDLRDRHNDLAGTIREWNQECIRLEQERDEARERLGNAQAKVEQVRDENAKLRSALFRLDPRHEEAVREALALDRDAGQPENPHD